MSALTISIQHHTGGHTGASVIRQEREPMKYDES